MKTIVLFVLLAVSPALSQDDMPLAAIVGEHEITVARVERHLTKTLGKKEFGKTVKPRLLGESLEHLIRRHAVLERITKEGIKVGDGEIRMEIEKLHDRLKEIDLPMDDYLASKKIKKTELEYEFRWRLAWGKYLKKHLTSEQLANFFERHRRRFDGTEMHVAHILFSSLQDKTSDVIKQAESIRRDIQEAKVTWDEAVKKHSEAKSSAEQAGEIGWITYQGPMPHEFCQAAMKLQAGEISPPVQTLFGVHLIKSLEIRPGKVGPKDSADELRDAATRFLFDSLADKERPVMKVDYKVEWPMPKK